MPNSKKKSIVFGAQKKKSEKKLFSRVAVMLFGTLQQLTFPYQSVCCIFFFPYALLNRTIRGDKKKKKKKKDEKNFENVFY